MHAGILAAFEKDFALSYSYFYESFDVFNIRNIENKEKALKALKYMILSKIMGSKLDEVNNIVYSKSAQKFFGRDVEALKKIEEAVRAKSVKQLQDTVNFYSDVLLNDSVINYHLNNLHGDILEQNLIKIIRPYSVVEIEFIALNIGLPYDEILSKLSQLILDKKINGILDQGRGSLIVYEETAANVIMF